MNMAIHSDDFKIGNARIIMPAGHEEMWLALRQMANKNTGFTSVDLAAASGATVGLAGFYLAKLTRNGIAVHVGQGADRSDIYAVAKMPIMPMVLDDRGNPSKDYTLRHALWNAVRMLKSFTARDLWSKVKDELSITKTLVLKFVTRLAKAGYLTELEGSGRFGDVEYALRPVMNTGRLPPRFCEAELVYDTNKRAFYGTAEAREVTL